MKVTAYVILGIAVAGVIYSLGPDMVRYLKIKSM